MRTIILFLLLASVSSAATITSQSNLGLVNWADGSTWIGGVAPGINDCGIIATGTGVSVAGTITYGTSGATGTTCLTVQGTGYLTFASGGLLNSRGSVLCPGSQTNTLGCIRTAAPAQLHWDTSVAGAGVQYGIKFAGAGAQTAINANVPGCNVNISATCFVVSADVGNFALIDDSDMTQGGMGICTGCVFQRIHWLPAPSPFATMQLTLTNFQFYDSWVDFAAACNANCTIALSRVSWASSSNPYTIRFGANGSGSVSMAHIVSDQPFGDGPNGGGSSTWTGARLSDVLAEKSLSAFGVLSSQSDSIYMLANSQTGQNLCGDAQNIWLWLYNHDNTHTHMGDLCSISSNLNRIWMASSTNNGTADGLVDPASGGNGKTYNNVGGFLLTQPNGNAMGSYLDHRGEVADLITFDHMTLSSCLSGTAAISEEAEAAAISFGNAAFLRNSAFYCTGTASYSLNSEIQNALGFPVTDPILPANIGSNARFGTKNSGTPACPNGCTNTNSYVAGMWSSSPGGTDITSNPQFLDPTRRQDDFSSRYLYTYLGLPAPSQWVTSHVYAIGDTVQNTKSGNPNGGEVIYFRAKVAHTSGAGTEPGSNWDAQAAWWADWNLETKSQISDSIISGASITDSTIGCFGCTYIQAMSNWVSQGFAPQNAAYHSALDGGWRGAVNASPLGTFIGGNSSVGGNVVIP